MTAREENSTEVKPLTKQRRETGEIYIRRPDAELQIEKVLTLDHPQILAMMENRRRDEADHLLDETIVYLIREARIAGDGRMIETLYTELDRRLWKLLAKFRAGFMNQADFEDFGQKIGFTIVRKILDTDSDSADYAQVNFGDFVISQAKGVWKQSLVRINREKVIFETAREGDDDDPLENISWSKELSAESKLIFNEGWRKLSSVQQTVVAMLRDGFQIESKNENEPTISRHLGVSSRTIRNWIREIRSILTDYQGGGKR